MAGGVAAALREDARPGSPLALLVADHGRRALPRVVLPLMAVAAGAWALTVRMGSGEMTMGAVAFLTGWVVMMVAMMLPATAPVVGVYALAARRGVVAAVPVFVAGYLALWVLSALPAYAVSRVVADPLAMGEPWMSRVVGATLITAAAYQLSPLKAACLRRCRSPLSFFLARGTSLARPGTAFRAGFAHGLHCLGCCWALMALLVVVGGMQLGWALALAAVITVEKLGPRGRATTRVIALAAAGLGVALLVQPDLLDHLVVVEAPMSPM